MLYKLRASSRINESSCHSYRVSKGERRSAHCVTNQLSVCGFEKRCCTMSCCRNIVVIVLVFASFWRSVHENSGAKVATANYPNRELMKRELTGVRCNCYQFTTLEGGTAWLTGCSRIRTWASDSYEPEACALTIRRFGMQTYL